MASVLTFSQYLGGPDNINVEQIFPSTQKTLAYNFARSVAGWTFKVDHQTVVVDTMSFDRNTGNPNFANSQVIGTFPYSVISTATYVNVVNSAVGIVNITIPANLYTGPILPDARANVPITIVGVTWQDAQTPPQINSHRWAFIQSYEPQVVASNPTTATNYSPIVVA